QALEQADRADVTPEQMMKAAERLKSAAEQIAVTAVAERTGAGPAWLLKTRPYLKSLSDHLGALLKADGGNVKATTASLLIKPMTPPLRLSYSAIDSYNRCPRCFYLSRVMNLPEPDSAETSIGTVAHLVLKRFY